MHCPRPRLVLPLAALLLAALSTSVPAARAAEPMVAAPRAVPAASMLAQAHLMGRQAADTPMNAALTLPLRNTAALDTLLKRLYTPGDPLCGHYLTSAQFDAQFGPAQSDYDAVTSYLRGQGLTVTPYASRTLVGVSATSAVMESAFHVHLNQYRTASGRIAFANDAAPLMPASIAARINGVVGLDDLVLPHPHLVVRPPASIFSHTVGSGAMGGLTPDDIKNIYNLNAASGVQLAGEGQSMALVELDGYDTGDIRQYITQFGLPINPDNTSILVNVPEAGYTGPSGGDGQVEVTLDIDMMLALAPRANHIYVYETSVPGATTLPNTSDGGVIFGILEVMTAIATDDFAQTVSCSWGYPEDYILALENGNTSQYAALLDGENAQLQKMSAQGQSFFCSAGDAGAYDDLITPSVDDPADQPYATAVGGTTLQVTNPATANAAYSSETTWDDGPGDAGGGGFSSFFGKPFYQYSSGSISDPANPVGATGGTYGLVPGTTLTFPSTPKRDLPDVSLNADPNTGYTIFAGITGQPAIVIGGTSAAAPLWAAFAALANEARAADSLGVTPGVSPGLATTPVGFINPLIYQIGYGQYGSYAQDFHDIADGSNNLLYRAGVGFDDATGWGSFNGANLLRDLAARYPNTVAGTTTGTGTTGTTTTTAVTFPPGIQMISEPQAFTGLTFADIFGLTTPVPSNGPILFQWQPQTQTYASSNGTTSATLVNTLTPGLGYWLYVPTYLTAGLTPTATGTVLTAPVTVSLSTGWNQIGDPYTSAEPLSSITVTAGTTASPLPGAGGQIYGTLYTYPAGATRYTAVSAASGAALQPYAGYWVYAFQPVTLTYN